MVERAIRARRGAGLIEPDHSALDGKPHGAVLDRGQTHAKGHVDDLQGLVDRSARGCTGQSGSADRVRQAVLW